MAVDERARHHLHGRLDEVLGADAAATLMGHLPPTGWGDVVTREYLDLRLAQFESRMDARFTAVDAGFARIDGRFDAVDGRFEAIDGRFEAVEARFDAIDERFVTLEARIETSRNEIIAAFRGELNEAVVAQSRLMVVSLFTALAALGGLTLGLARFAA